MEQLNKKEEIKKFITGCKYCRNDPISNNIRKYKI